MITIKSEYELSLMRIAGRIVYDTHQYIKDYIKPGITTGELDKLAHDYIISRDATPSCLGYEGYPASICISVNEEVVHGIPGKRKLKNGDIVEIITSDQAKGPSRDWLKFVKSSSAKNKIQQWFKKAEREDNIVKGKDLIEKEIKRIGMNYSTLFKNEYVQVALNRYKFNTIDDMYSAVGFGAISSSRIIAKMLEAYKKDNQDEEIEKRATLSMYFFSLASR